MGIPFQKFQENSHATVEIILPAHEKINKQEIG